MSRRSILTIQLCISIFIILPWCNSVFQTNEKNIEPNQIFQNLLNNKITNKYKKVIQSWNIQENLDIKMRWVTKNTIFELVVSSISAKNIFSGYQNGKYQFILTTENKMFLEKTIISWNITLISTEKEYFVKPENIKFVWPKWKYSNKEAEEKINEINNKRIKIDKEIPFISFLTTILDIQNLSYILLISDKSSTIFNTNINENWSINILNPPKNYENLFSSWIFNTNSWSFYLWGSEIFVRQKIGKIFKTKFSLKKWDLISEVKIKKGRDKIKIYFDGGLFYNKLPNISEEIKLDIKWKYIILGTWNVKIDIPKNYIYFTEASISSK